MIDFDNGFIKLRPVDINDVRSMVEPMLVDGENIFGAFSTVRDKLIFTTKRIIAVNQQGMLGSKVDFTSLPYSKIQAFSIETSGTFDRDCELQIYISSIGLISFEFTGGFDIKGFNRLISTFVL